MPRIFIYDGREFDDPDPEKTPEEVAIPDPFLRRPTATHGDHGGLEGEVELLRTAPGWAGSWTPD